MARSRSVRRRSRSQTRRRRKQSRASRKSQRRRRASACSTRRKSRCKAPCKWYTGEGCRDDGDINALLLALAAAPAGTVTAKSIVAVANAQQLTKRFQKGYMPPALVNVVRSVQMRSQPGAGAERFRQAINKVKTMQSTVGAFQLSQSVLSDASQSGDPNAFAAAAVKLVKPTLLGLMQSPAPSLAGGQQEQQERQQLETALNNLESLYAKETSPTAIQQATELLTTAVSKVGKILMFILACGIILTMALSGSIPAIVISIGLFYKLSQLLWQSFLDASTWVASTLARLMFESVRLAFLGIQKVGQYAMGNESVPNLIILFFSALSITQSLLKPMVDWTPSSIDIHNLYDLFNMTQAINIGDLFK